MKNILIVVLVIIVLGGLAYGLKLVPKSEVLPKTVDTEPKAIVDISKDGVTDAVSGMRAEENAVVATDQRPGTVLHIAHVYLAAPGYVVVYEDVNDVAGATLGSSALLPTGESNNVAVTLTRVTTDGEKLWAMLHAEKNNNTTFNATLDSPVASQLGGAIMGWFMIAADVSENPAVTI